MAQPTIEEVKALMSELGFSLPDTVLSLIMEQVGEKDACLSQYGDSTSKLLSLYAVARWASLSGARRIASQSSPSGGGRSFNYDPTGTKYLVKQIRALDKMDCLLSLPLEGDQIGFFAVVGD